MTLKLWKFIGNFEEYFIENSNLCSDDLSISIPTIYFYSLSNGYYPWTWENSQIYGHAEREPTHKQLHR